MRSQPEKIFFKRDPDRNEKISNAIAIGLMKSKHVVQAVDRIAAVGKN